MFPQISEAYLNVLSEKEKSDTMCLTYLESGRKMLLGFPLGMTLLLSLQGTQTVPCPEVQRIRSSRGHE